MKRKTIFWIVGIIVLFVIIAKVVSVSRADGALRVTVAKAGTSDIVETVVANGKIQPETEVIISSEVSGKILELPFKEGARVKKGDLLVRINPDLAQAASDRAEAAMNNARANRATSDARLLQAEAQFRNSELIYKRNQNLLKEGAISQAEFDNVRATFESAEAEVLAARESVKAAGFTVQSSQASLKEARDSYNRTTIYAPMDGVISRLSMEVGEQVVGAMQMTGTEIMRVANLDVMEVLTDVNESDIVRIGFGDTSEVEVDAYLNRTFKGVVTEIANSAKSTGASADQVTSFEVKIRIIPESYSDVNQKAGSDLSPFRPGMNATVEIITARKIGVLSVPIESITARTDTSTAKERSAVDRVMGEEKDANSEPITCVFIHNAGSVTLRAVTTGIQDDARIEILSGLQEGDEIVSGPFDLVSQKLMPGDKVEVVGSEELYKKD